MLQQNQARISELTEALEKERLRISQQGNDGQADKIRSLTLALEEEQKKAALRSAEAASLAQDKAELLAKNEAVLREMSELSRSQAAAIQDLTEQLEQERQCSKVARLDSARLISEGQKIMSDNEQLQELVLALKEDQVGGAASEVLKAENSLLAQQNGQLASDSSLALARLNEALALQEQSLEAAERLQAENARLAQMNEKLISDGSLVSARLDEALGRQELSQEAAERFQAESIRLTLQNEQLVNDGGLALARLNEALERTTGLALLAEQEALQAELEESEAGNNIAKAVELALARMNGALERTKEMARQAEQEALQAEQDASESADRMKTVVDTPQIQRSELLALSEQLEQERNVSEKLRLSNAELAEANERLQALGERLSQELERFRKQEAEDLQDSKLMMDKMEAMISGLPAALEGNEESICGPRLGTVLPLPAKDTATAPLSIIEAVSKPQVSEDRASPPKKKWDQIPTAGTAKQSQQPPAPKSKPQGKTSRKHD